MICPYCKEWLESICTSAEETIKVFYSIDKTGRVNQTSETMLNDSDLEDPRCPDCDGILGEYYEVLERFKKCKVKEYKEKCETCEDRFVCLTMTFPYAERSYNES